MAPSLRARRAAALAALLAVPATAAPPSREPDLDAAAREVRAVLSELVAADTTNPPGNEARAVAIAAARLAAEGIPFERHAFAPGRENLVARLRGEGREPPVLLLAHTDVVGAEGQPWTSAPHQVTERDGFLVGRGVRDDLGMAAVELEVMLMLHREKARLRRDVVLALTGDEESGGSGIRSLLRSRPEALADAGVVLNEGGGATLDDGGRARLVTVGTAEKTYQDVTLRVHGTTGHSSVPHGTNAIARVARAIDRIESHPFPPRLLPVTRAYFRARAAVEPPEVAAAMRTAADAPGAPPEGAVATLERNPALHALLRTTCTPTLVSGGTRENALPPEASANLNCRILPDETPEDVRRALVEIVGDPEVEVALGPAFGPGGQSPVGGEALAAIARSSERVYGRVPIVPSMTVGGTDCRFLRERGVACYGLDPLAASESDARRAHGVDERVAVSSLRSGVELLHALVLDLAGRR
jgi:acetylornithine deacetylase/succinyl-diaminopimelate desuccinylase-like protein